MQRMAKIRGVFEQKPGVWWIQYFADGKRRREKVGRKSDAIKLYQTRKAEIYAGIKLPGHRGRGQGGVKFGELVDDVIAYTREHKSARTYEVRGGIIKRVWGKRIASTITPPELETWLADHCKTPASVNRYRAIFSLCFRRGMENGKVSVNPARLVRHRREPRGRMRFLTREEFEVLRGVIEAQHPAHVTEFVVSVHTGMRLGEQYALRWRQVHLNRRVIELYDTKNGESRTVHLNQTAVDALAALDGAKDASVFPHKTKRPRPESWFEPCLKTAGIHDYTWHNNRHTFCSWLAMAGASIREIMEAAGHKSVSMAARYAHLSPAHTRSVVDRLV